MASLTPDDFRPPAMNPELARRIAAGHDERQARLEQAMELAASGTTETGHDSTARRAALAKHLDGLNLSPQEIATRLLMDVSFGASAATQIAQSQRERGHGIDQARSREHGVERGREAPGREL